MPRSPRIDHPGAWHHVVNRGIARRTVFEGTQDVRYFKSRLAREVRAGRIEVHAFAVLSTHFHLLVRSPRGSLSEAMQRAQNSYVRWFNRRRRRDGPLFRGRFRSHRIESDTYREAVLWYIDRNPVSARLVTASHHYPHGSALHYAQPAGPRWLERSFVEALSRAVTGLARYEPGAYPRLCADAITSGACDVVAQRLRSARIDGDPLDDLVCAAPPEVRRWMETKAALADGTAPGVVLVSAATIRRLVAQQADRFAHAEMRGNVEAGLVRTVCGASFAEIAGRLRVSPEVARRRFRRHVEALRDVPAYAAAAAAIVHAALLCDFPRKARRCDVPYALPTNAVRRPQVRPNRARGP